MILVRSIAALVFAVVFALAFGPATAAQDGAITTTPVSLDPEKGPRSDETEVGDLVFRGGVELRSARAALGGLSGLHITGERMIAVSDCGYWLTATLGEKGGRLDSLRNVAIVPILDTEGYALNPNEDCEGDESKRRSDAESIAAAPAGGLFVAFERYHRIRRYPEGPLSARAIAGPALPEDASLERNRGIEALARLSDGRLLALAEKEKEGEAPGWLIGSNGGTTPFRYIVDDDYVPTGASAIPGGGFLVLERSYRDRVTRVRLVAVNHIPSEGKAIKGKTIASFRNVPGKLRESCGNEGVQFPDGAFCIDKFEGVAVRKDSGGGLDVFLVSDADHHRNRHTLLLKFSWTR